MTKLDIEKPFEEQGEINIFLHKLTDVIASADQGEEKTSIIINRIEQYLSNHPNVLVIDPLDNVRILLNRFNYYSILKEESSLRKIGIFTPTFAEFKTNNINENYDIMRQNGVTFPVICKPTVAHGSKLAHEMVVIFNKRGLSVCKPPCVVQSFVNHNAVLHKIFVVGNRYNIAQRPSLKNFYASDDLDPIFYSTGEVCKADSQSTLSILDPQDMADRNMCLNEDKIKTIIQILRRRIGLVLYGFDVVIDNVTGNHAVIDINVFPSYDNFPNFFEHLLECIEEMECTENSNGVTEVCSRNRLINVGSCSNKYGVVGMNIN
ncbi:inositol-tetrakisphosphate 1-kinase-like isoform X2 [Aricia agestis]|uniref:inositol-tetrakisphosphate 1-kinase-like isoform X2 n=1 Tax=Aricia agestis TaxID=91739 RepID=UPI001C202CF3|nr:inositol-tetrakisphosphate 1-kinase-like isoform X2 [Aricia agestis]